MDSFWLHILCLIWYRMYLLLINDYERQDNKKIKWMIFGKSLTILNCFVHDFSTCLSNNKICGIKFYNHKPQWEINIKLMCFLCKKTKMKIHLLYAHAKHFSQFSHGSLWPVQNVFIVYYSRKMLFLFSLHFSFMC